MMMTDLQKVTDRFGMVVQLSREPRGRWSATLSTGSTYHDPVFQGRGATPSQAIAVAFQKVLAQRGREWVRAELTRAEVRAFNRILTHLPKR